MTEWEKFQSFLYYTKEHFNHFKTWSDNEKLSECVRSIECEINRLKDKGLIDLNH